MDRKVTHKNLKDSLRYSQFRSRTAGNVIHHNAHSHIIFCIARIFMVRQFPNSYIYGKLCRNRTREDNKFTRETCIFFFQLLLL